MKHVLFTKRNYKYEHAMAYEKCAFLSSPELTIWMEMCAIWIEMLQLESNITCRCVRNVCIFLHENFKLKDLCAICL